MNRREALQSGLGILAASQIDGEVATITTKNPQAFIITTERQLSSHAVECLRKQWNETFLGTAIEKVPIVLLPYACKLEVIDEVGDAG